MSLSVLKLRMHCVGIRAGARVALALNGGHRSTTSKIEVISKWLNMPRRNNFDNRSFTQSYNFDFRSYFDFRSGKDLILLP